MQAIIIRKAGGPDVLDYRTRPLPEPAAHQVLLRVTAAGVNRSDVLLRAGKYAGATGRGAEVTCWHPGDTGCALLPQGGYAEYAVADARHCLPVPAGLSLVKAASLSETALTVWHNVFEHGGLRAGETLLAHGGSGSGVLAVQLARALGSRCGRLGRRGCRRGSARSRYRYIIS